MVCKIEKEVGTKIQARLGNQKVYDLRCFDHQMLYEFDRRRIYADIRNEVNEELRRRGISLA